MLAGLVLASFTVVPPSRGPVAVAVVSATPEEPASERVAPMSRGLARTLRMVDNLEVTDFETATATPSLAIVAVSASPPAPEQAAAPEAKPETALGPVPKAEPEATPEPKPEPTPEPTPAPTPPISRPPPAVGWVTTATTLWAEGHMLELMNATRARGGLLPLAMDIGVGDAARAHSAAEARVRYVYHDGPDGTAASRNVPACGTGWYGENTGKIWNDNPDALHIEFMAEPWAPINHRTNIMDPNFRRVGVGAVMGPDAMYMTMVFCR
jgi:uncharacterized protein YkwD